MSDLADRYCRGELTAEEARALAREALDSPELFDELTDSALVQTTLGSQTPPSLPNRGRAGAVTAAIDARRFRRRAIIGAGVAALAAAAVTLAIVWPRPHPAAPQLLRPVLMSANPNQPVLLASGLKHTDAPVFRGGEEASRPARQQGTVVAADGDAFDLDLGSLDGLTKGSQVAISRGASAVARLRVTAVFRTHARAERIDGSPAHVKDTASVNEPDYRRRLLHESSAAFQNGDTSSAATLADQACQSASLERDSPALLAPAWNQAAVLKLLAGDSDQAGPLLERAVSKTADTDAGRGEMLNNLGVWNELRGHREQAIQRYTAAAAILSGADRETAERNLARVRGH